MAQNVEELLAPLPNMLSQIQQDGDSSPKGVSQFKAPLRLQSSVQPGKLLEQGRPSSILGSTPSKGVSQFKAPLRLQSSVQPGKLLEQGQPSSSFGVPPFNSASQLF